MKFKAMAAAAAAALTLLSAAVSPFAAYAAAPSMPAVTLEITAASKEDAASQMRSALKAHQTSFSVNFYYDGEKIDLKDMSGLMMYNACDETGVGTEGDYLRFAIKRYKCNAKSSGNNYILDYEVDYYTTPEEEERLTDEINKLVESLDLASLSDYAKIRVLYKYVTSNITYSQNISDPYVYSAYCAVFNKHAVCQGITQLLYRLYNDNGIPCRIIAGKSHDYSEQNADGYHVWLIVKLNGSYYLLDPTWDLKYKGMTFHYFLKGSGDFDSDIPSLTHIAQNDNGLSFPDYNSEAFRTKYPLNTSLYPEPVCTLGDISGNGSIDAVDASMILMEYARLSAGRISSFTTSQYIYADVDHNGKSDAVDASKVLAYYAAKSSGNEQSLNDYIKSH
ncbi:transglutaminase domain-containing protein [Ruminococcus sp.]|uniref:transglutaminase domain-containing protein n=1 Tax=Ruminococcus sp. TaxID=41978 RepID=UPI002C7CA30F|nr:transglutaminase domain-containing protein [Ruminococcus sp.]HOH88148.1 transglutaminase domain-containing protein [Ruminococcus sp.]